MHKNTNSEPNKKDAFRESSGRKVPPPPGARDGAAASPLIKLPKQGK
jgi:hypothetical protein